MHQKSHPGKIQDFYLILPRELVFFSSVQFTDSTNPFPMPGKDDARVL
jgi:hypothetical protein